MAKRSVAVAVVAVVALLAAGAGLLAARVETDDDVLAFLPKDDPAVRDFREVSARFGGLDVAIAGLEADDVLRPEFLDRIAAATKRLAAVPGAGSVLSLTNVECMNPDPMGGVKVEYLTADRGPGLRERVLGNHDVVGQLVDPEGKATVLMVFANRGADTLALAGGVRAVMEELFPGETRVYGGAPFISSYLTGVTQRDLRRLAPFAVAALILVTALAFRSLAGTALVLATAGIAIVLVLGAMGALGVRSNLVLGSMPILVFALGGGYAVHVVVAHGTGRRLVDVGPAVAASGLAAAGGMLSFLVMDIAPLRAFGVVTAAGLVVATVLALTFVPAMLRLFPVEARPAGGWLERLGRGRAAAAGLALAALAAAPFALGLRARMDDAAFFDAGSPPARADAFLRQRFGGASFIQIEVEGDLTEPLLLREVAEIADRAALLPGVSRVTHVGEVLAITHAALSGERVLPDTADKARVLYSFLEGKSAVRQLVDDERRHALIQVKLSSSRPEDAAPVLAALRTLARERSGERVTVKGHLAHVLVRQAAVVRIEAIFRHEGQAPADLDARLAAGPPPDAPDTRARVEAGLAAYFASDEYMGELPDEPGAAQRTAAAVMDGSNLEPLGRDGMRVYKDLFLRERARDWARLLVPQATPAQSQAVSEALLDLPREVALSGVGHPGLPIDVRVTGQPVLHEALSRAVDRNLARGVAVALLVFTVVSIAFLRSPRAGLAAVLPSVVTLLILGAAMRLLGLTVDLGTVMLPVLVLGAGAAASFDRSAPAVFVATLMAAAGFLVLTFGEARPLRVVGGLTAAGLVVVALATFAFVRRSQQ